VTELLIGLGVFAFLILLGLIAGTLIEQAHFRRLAGREAEVARMLVTQLKSFPFQAPGEQPPRLLIGEAVISADYLKSFLASLRKSFGGEMRSYKSLLDRARREATLRILEQARGLGYNAVCNVRYYNADVGGNTTGGKVNMVAILASGTGYHSEPAAAAS